MGVLKARVGGTWVDVVSSPVGVPAGGADNAVLRKTSTTDYATAWETLTTADLSGMSAFAVTLLDDTSATAMKDTLGLNALVAGARVDLPAPSGGSQVIDVDMSEGQAGNQVWNGGLNDADTLTINANAGANTAELEINCGALDLNSSGAFTLDAVTNAFQGLFGNTINNTTITGTADETGTTTPTATMVITGTATNDDIIERVYPYKVLTTDATIKTLATLTAATIPNDSAVMVEARVLGHRTSGSGSAGDSACYIVVGSFKDVAGTVTQLGTAGGTKVVEHESVAGWDCVVNATGGSVRVQVTGAATTNISWTCMLRMYSLGT